VSMSPRTPTSMVNDEVMFNGSNHMMDYPSVGDTVPCQVLGNIFSYSSTRVSLGDIVHPVMHVEDDTVGNGLAILLRDVVVDLTGVTISVDSMDLP
jgi:hypothetical protein